MSRSFSYSVPILLLRNRSITGGDTVPTIRAGRNLGESFALEQKRVDRKGTNDKRERVWGGEGAGRGTGERSWAHKKNFLISRFLPRASPGTHRHQRVSGSEQADGATSQGFPKWLSNIFLTLSQCCLVFTLFQITDVLLLFNLTPPPPSQTWVAFFLANSPLQLLRRSRFF